MTNGKMIAIIAAAALAACIGLAGCGGTQASSSAAQSSSATASSAAASTSAPASSSAAAPSSSAASSSAAAPSSASASASSSAASSASDIGKDAAKSIALKDAGVAEADCTEIKVALDTDDAIVHYDVDFKAGGMEYDYDINPETGAIIKQKSEVDD